MKISVLIISYTFPPASGIGGRRWAKFAKYFNILGTSINAITVRSNSSMSEWKSDIEDIKSNIKFINSNYPKVLSTIPYSVLSKIKYHLALGFVKLFVKGNYFDKFSLARHNLCKAVEKSIRENKVSHVIVTVAPFHGAYIISRIIEKYPDIIFVVDFRDPWLNNKTAYGYESLKTKRKKFETKAEMKVMERFDYIVSVSEYMTNAFKKKYSHLNSSKFLTFENGYDPQDINLEPNNNLTDKENINITFTGALYNNSHRALEIMRSKMLEFSDLKIYQDIIKWNFYGDVKKDLLKPVNLIGETIFYGRVEKPKALNAIFSSDICLLILSDDIDYSFSTKFCEYVWFRKPIMVIADSSSPTGNFVSQNNIGFHLHESVSIDQILTFFNNIKSSKYYLDFDTSFLNVQEISKNYLQFLKSARKYSLLHN